LFIPDVAVPVCRVVTLKYPGIYFAYPVAVTIASATVVYGVLIEKYHVSNSLVSTDFVAMPLVFIMMVYG
jgi:hypothetical protein